MTWKFVLKLVILPAGLCLFTSCSNLKIAWNHFERLSMFYIDDYIDFSSQQKTELKHRISLLKQDHLVHSLPQLIDHLDEWVVAINAKTLDEGKVENLLQEGEKLLLPVRQQLARESTTLIQKMNAKQRDHLVKSFSERLEEKREMPKAKLDRKIEKRFRSNMERFFGEVEENQEDVLAHFQTAAKKEQPKLVRCQTQALEAFKIKLNQDTSALKEFIQAYFTAPEKIQSEECSQLNQQRQQRWTATLLQLQPLLTKSQKRHFQERIQNWQSDIREIYKKEITLSKS